MSKAHVNTHLRSDMMWNHYQSVPKRPDFMSNPEDLKIVVAYKYWHIFLNEFPYDEVAEVHHLLAPKDKYANEDELPNIVLDELFQIMDDLEKSSEYDCIMKNFPVAQSIPTHLHYHLLTWKRRA
jgi:diadenosine tetraphosphate (Ap4A) HIT family hydrolase